MYESHPEHWTALHCTGKRHVLRGCGKHEDVQKPVKTLFCRNRDFSSNLRSQHPVNSRRTDTFWCAVLLVVPVVIRGPYISQNCKMDVVTFFRVIDFKVRSEKTSFLLTWGMWPILMQPRPHAELCAASFFVSPTSWSLPKGRWSTIRDCFQLHHLCPATTRNCSRNRPLTNWLKNPYSYRSTFTPTPKPIHNLPRIVWIWFPLGTRTDSKMKDSSPSETRLTHCSFELLQCPGATFCTRICCQHIRSWLPFWPETGAALFNSKRTRTHSQVHCPFYSQEIHVFFASFYPGCLGWDKCSCLSCKDSETSGVMGREVTRARQTSCSQKRQQFDSQLQLHSHGCQIRNGFITWFFVQSGSEEKRDYGAQTNNSWDYFWENYLKIVAVN